MNLASTRLRHVHRAFAGISVLLAVIALGCTNNTGQDSANVAVGGHVHDEGGEHSHGEGGEHGHGEGGEHGDGGEHGRAERGEHDRDGDGS